MNSVLEPTTTISLKDEVLDKNGVFLDPARLWNKFRWQHLARPGVPFEGCEMKIEGPRILVPTTAQPFSSICRAVCKLGVRVNVDHIAGHIPVLDQQPTNPTGWLLVSPNPKDPQKVHPARKDRIESRALTLVEGVLTIGALLGEGTNGLKLPEHLFLECIQSKLPAPDGIYANVDWGNRRMVLMSTPTRDVTYRCLLMKRPVRV